MSIWQAIIIHQKIDRKQGTKYSKQHLKKKLSYSDVSSKEQMLLHANSKVMSVKLPTIQNPPCFDLMLQQDWHLIGKIDYTVCMFRHGEIHLLLQVRRIAQHRDRTRRGNLAHPFQLVFRIWSCIFSFGMHISSWSRTCDTTLIRGLNHGWNRAFIMHLILGCCTTATRVPNRSLFSALHFALSAAELSQLFYDGSYPILPCNLACRRQTRYPNYDSYHDACSAFQATVFPLLSVNAVHRWHCYTALQFVCVFFFNSEIYSHDRIFWGGMSMESQTKHSVGLLGEPLDVHSWMSGKIVYLATEMRIIEPTTACCLEQSGTWLCPMIFSFGSCPITLARCPIATVAPVWLLCTLCIMQVNEKPLQPHRTAKVLLENPPKK